MKIAVAMSGGLDSSVTAALLKKEGHEVFGLTMLVTPSEVVADAGHDAAQALGIPHHIVDFRAIFSQNVISPFCLEYNQGRTPNPCVHCNRVIKFGVLLEKAKELGAGAMATGHYARIQKLAANGRFAVQKGVDITRDQSYFLYKLTQPQLSNAIFPLGGMTKDNVRKIAAEMNLPALKQKESREICFIPDNDYARFLRENRGLKPPSGNIVDKQGEVLGQHNGIIDYTIGQRKGMGIASARPLFVIDIDIQTNTVTVGGKEDVYRSEFVVADVNWMAVESLNAPLTLKVKIRYLHKQEEAIITPFENDKVNVKFNEPQMAITPGQAAVFYDGDVVVGGGTIERVLH